MDLICIVLGADTKKDRTRDSIELIEYAFKTFFPYNIKEKIENEFQNWILCNSNSFYVSKGSSNDISPFEIFSFISFAFSSESTNMCFEETVSGVLNSSACSL